MATSESDDFESADEEMNHDISIKKHTQMQQWSSPNTVGSESDDDMEYVPRQPCTNVNLGRRREKYCPTADTSTNRKKVDKDISIKDTYNYKKYKQPVINVDEACGKIDENITCIDSEKVGCAQANTGDMDLKVENNNKNTTLNKTKVEKPTERDIMDLHSEVTLKLTEKEQSQRKEKKLGAKKLGTKVTPSSNFITDIDNRNKRDVVITEEDVCNKSSIKDEITESDMPEELKSEKTFKEVFKPEGWEGLGDSIELPDELTEEKLQPVLKRLSLVGEETSSSSGWGWGNWDVSSLINTATAGVSTLTSHVSQGFTLLEESMAISDEPKSITNKEEEENQTDNGTP